MKPETYNPNEAYCVAGTYDVMDKPAKPGERNSFKWRDKNHTPHNKRSGEVISNARLVVTDEPNGMNMNYRPGDMRMPAPAKGWLQIQLEEMTQTKTGVVQTRTISVTLSADARKALLAYLLATEG